MTPSEALAKLGLEPGAPTVVVREKWLNLRKEHHPDYGGDAEKFHELHEAYKVAFTNACSDVPEQCPWCGGSGKVRSPVGWSSMVKICEICLGSGQVVRR
jgi:DnaJ-class molecular chaperone